MQLVHLLPDTFCQALLVFDQRNSQGFDSLPLQQIPITITKKKTNRYKPEDAFDNFVFEA